MGYKPNCLKVPPHKRRKRLIPRRSAFRNCYLEPIFQQFGWHIIQTATRVIPMNGRKAVRVLSGKIEHASIHPRS
jgi:hypothetical protein